MAKTLATFHSSNMQLLKNFLVGSTNSPMHRLLIIFTVLITLYVSSLSAQNIPTVVPESPPFKSAIESLFESARLQTELNELSDAQDNYLAGIELLVQESGEYSPSLIQPYIELARTFSLNEKTVETITILEQAQHISQRNFGLLNMDQISLLDDMSSAYLLMGDTIQSENIQQERLALALRRYGEDDPQVIPFRRHLANYYDLSRMRGLAREQFEDILEIQQENFGEYGDRQLATLSELVRIDILLGNTRASRRHLLAMLEFKDMMSPTEVGNALTVLGDWDQTLGQTETALKYYQEAHRLLTVKQPSLGIQHFSTPKLINFIPPPSPVDIQGNHTRYIWSSVLLRFNISSLGIANNIEIMEPSISGLMDSLYIARLSEAVYRPRLVDGEPLDTIGVFYRHNFRYFIEDN